MTDGANTLGTVTGHRMLHLPGTIVPGKTALGRATSFVFAPDDYHHVPGVLVYAGVPQLSPGVEIEFGRAVETIIPFAARCFQHSSGYSITVAYLRDMTFP